MDAAGDREKQQEQLRHALLAAADEEGEAIVEQARRDITLAVRRARRDLHLIRAQLNLCGVEVPPLPLTAPPNEQGGRSLGDGVPPDAIVVGRTHTLRHAVTEASLELAQLSGEVGAPAAPAAPAEAPATPADDAVINWPAPESTAPRTTRSWSLIAACGLVLVVTGLAGWTYWRQDTPPAPVAVPGDATRRSAPVPTTAVADDASAPATASPAVLPSRVVLRTVRPVWMRIEVDGRSDVGRAYPEGTVQEFTPARDVLIRAGDAGAVLLGIGSEAPAVMGRAGQVITRRIAVGEPQTTSPPSR